MNHLDSDWWERFTKPHHAIRTLHKRNEAQFLSAFSLVLFGVHLLAFITTLIVWPTVDSDIVVLIGIGTLNALIAYYLSRTPRYRLGQMLIVISATALSYSTTAIEANPMIGFVLIMPVFIISLFYPTQFVIVFTAISLLYLNIIVTRNPAPVFVDSYAEIAIIFTNLLFIVISVLIIASAWLRQRAQSNLEEKHQQLQASEARFRVATDSSLDAFYLLKSIYGASGEIIDFEFIDINEAGEQQAGLSRNEILGHRLRELFDGPHVEENFQKNKRVAETGVSLAGEFFIPDGYVNSGWYYQHYSPSTDGTAVTSRNITQRKANEAEELQLILERERVDLLKRFIDEVAHDIKTPLTLVKAASHLILQNKLPPEKDLAYRQKIKQGVEQLEHMINNILDMGKLHAPDEHYDYQDLDLNQFIQRAYGDYVRIAHSHGIRLTYDAAPQSLLIKMDTSRLRRAIDNIIDNALKFTPKDGHIEIKTGMMSNRAMLTITDNGNGIPQEQLPHIFKQFYRGADHRPSDGSAGLGLSITQKIIMAHQGNIEVESQTNKGTSFRLLFPLAMVFDEPNQNTRYGA